ncbi:MAG: hypothetical protein SWH78_15670 [Thermodesulfobacteriota bacterium]|nr:hypothetical protein [Thermodesulfobacteriota bacterium]
MMTLKRCISVLLLPLLMTSWLSMAMWRDDPSTNGRMDLEDAIVLMKDFTHTAQDPSAFTASVTALLSTLQQLAGLKTVITPAKDVQSGSSCSSPTLPYLASSCNGSALPDIESEVPEAPFYSESAEPEPVSPPPRAV